MNIEDLAKKAINEVNSELDQKDEFAPIVEESRQDNDDLDIQEYKIKQEVDKVAQELMQELEQLEVQITSEKPIVKVEESRVLDDDQIINSEEFFLKSIRERILVLFEGLKNTKDDYLEKRLEITITFLEFLLAKIEDRLKK